MENLIVGKVLLDEITGKRNLPGLPAAADQESGQPTEQSTYIRRKVPPVQPDLWIGDVPPVHA